MNQEHKAWATACHWRWRYEDYTGKATRAYYGVIMNEVLGNYDEQIMLVWRELFPDDFGDS